MRISLKNIIVPSIPLAVLLVVSCFVLWMSAFMGGHFATIPNQFTLSVQRLQSVFIPNTLLSNLICISFTLFNAFFIAQINNKFTIIRTRTFLPILIFLLLLSTWGETHVANGSHVALTLVILSLFKFFSMPRDRKASEEAFMGSFLISVSSLLVNPFIFIIPLCWIGFIMFQSFSLRTFLASIFGAITPWILYLSVRYLISPDMDFREVFTAIPNFDLSTLSISLITLIYICSIILILIISIFGLLSLSNGDAIHTRNRLNFLIFLLITISILALLFRNQYVYFLPLIAMIYALLVSHPFTLKQNNFYGILFIIFIVINIAFIVSKYFQI